MKTTRYSRMSPEQKAKDKARAAAWHKKNPERASDHYRKSMCKRRGYAPPLPGPSLGEFQAQQGGLCAVIGCPRLADHLDHCHTSGRRRGALCSQHNTALGLCGDSRSQLFELAAYLLRTT